MTKRFQQWAALGLVCAGVGSGLRSGAQPPLPPPEFGPVIVNPDDPHTPKRATDEEYRNALVAALYRFAERPYNADAERLAALLSRHPELVDARLTFRQPHIPGATDGFAALHFAAGAGNREAVKVLLAYKANVNGDSGGGWAPLHHAARAGHLDVVKQLVGAGAKVGAKTHARPAQPVPNGAPGAAPLFAPAVPAYSALDLAKAGKHAAVIEYLEGLSR